MRKKIRTFYKDDRFLFPKNEITIYQIFNRRKRFSRVNNITLEHIIHSRNRLPIEKLAILIRNLIYQEIKILTRGKNIKKFIDTKFDEVTDKQLVDKFFIVIKVK